MYMYVQPYICKTMDTIMTSYPMYFLIYGEHYPQYVVSCSNLCSAFMIPIVIQSFNNLSV